MRWWRPVCLGSAVALLVATPLVPTERTELTGNALPYVMLWLLLGLVWFAGAALLRVPLAKLDWIDALMVALAAWHVLSGLVMMYHGAPRLTINAMWTWVSFAVIVVMLRQLVRGRIEAKALCAVMIALAVCLSTMAFYQTFVTYPAQRAFFENDPAAALAESGIHAPEGSAARRQFESRLYSSEPTATFSLTNSLAGYLAPWLVFVVGMVIANLPSQSEVEEQAKDLPGPNASESLWWFGAIASALCIAVCLVLTNSRTGWLATMVGCAFVAGIALWQRGRRKLVLLLGSQLALLTLLVATLAWLQALPTRVISAAVLSLKQSTLAMIGDYPLFGCGPGNFQNYYTTYKLPQASETVSDPHSFAMELAAVAGVPALVIFVVLMGWLLIARGARAVEDGDANDRPENQPSVSPSILFIGFAVAAPLAITLNLVTENYLDTLTLVVGFMLGGLTLSALRPWTLHGEFPGWLPPVVIAVLLFNLLAAGGISFPGVMITLWVMIAVMTSARRTAGWQPSPLAALVIFTPVTLALLITGYQTAYRPVLTRQSLMASLGENRGKFYMLHAEWAGDADPWSPQPDLFLASSKIDAWTNSKNNDYLQQGENHIARMLELDRHSSQMEAAAGFLYLLIAEAETSEATKYQQLAINHFERAVELYPSDAMAHAQLAMTCHRFELPDKARTSAEEALALDRLCPHEERKLANRRVFAEIAVAQHSKRFQATSGQSAEQWMYEIRNNAE